MTTRAPQKATTNKLSRKRPLAALNDSGDDFQTESLRSVPREKKPAPPPAKEDDLSKAEAEGNVAGDAPEAVPPCPICGKTFRDVQLRNRHLKGCATERGMTTEQVLKIRRLEEKQAEERRALGLPAVPPASDAKNVTKLTRSSVTVAKIQKSVDPHLEMALALSTSLANFEAMKQEEDYQNLEALGVDTKVIRPAVQTEPIPPLLITSYAEPRPQSSSDSKARRTKRTAKTALEVRTQNDREQQISARASAVMFSMETEGNAGSSIPTSVFKHQEALNISSSQGLFQSARREYANTFWTRASSSSANFISESIRPYLHKIESDIHISQEAFGLGNKDDQALRTELRKFGLKAIPRRKAIPLLNHIYEQTLKRTEINKDMRSIARMDQEDDDILSKSLTTNSSDSENESDIHISQDSSCLSNKDDQALRMELKKFGLKAIPRRKAIPLLNHIYEQTQKIKINEDMGNVARMDQENDDILSKSLTTNSSDSENEGDIPLEESILLGMQEQEDDEPPVTSTQKAVVLSGTSLSKCILEFVQNDKDLHTRALLYEPIWLEECFASFKNSANVKCKLNEFTDVLDSECITFRTKSGTNRNRQNKGSPKKRKTKPNS